MDVQQFVSNKELLERLSREYELLKASGAEVDYPAWVRQRLREAATKVAEATDTKKINAEGASAASGVGGEPANVSGDLEALGPSTASQRQEAKKAELQPRLSFSRFPQSSQLGQAHQQPTTEVVRDTRPETAWFLRGEGSSALAAAMYGPAVAGRNGWPAQVGKKPAQKQKRVVVVSPRTTERAQQPAAAAAPVSKLYTKEEPGLFSARPDAYVQSEARAKRLPAAARRPDWVNAASLQAALRGAASVVPHLQAAAERERRLALSSALARSSLASGLDPDEARARALYGAVPGAPVPATAAQDAQYEHVMRVAEQLASQNEALTRAVQQNSVQLAQQQALLQSALGDVPKQVVGDAATDPASKSQDPVVEVETGPAPWFARRKSGAAPIAPLVAGGRPPTGRAPSAPRLKTRARSPLPEAASTAKERERASRKEALKALLQEVLGGAGLGVGAEGRRRLSKGMAEAEKLVAAIGALAGTNASAGMKKSPTDVKVPAAAFKAPVDLRRVSTEASADHMEPSRRAAHAAAGGRTKAATRASGDGGCENAGAGARSNSRPPSLPTSKPTSHASSMSGEVHVPHAGGSTSALSSRAPSGQGFGMAKSASADSLQAKETTEVEIAGPQGSGNQHVGAAAAGLGNAVSARGEAGASAPAMVAATNARAVHAPHLHVLPPGMMVESLEDQVAHIVQRDAAAFAEMERLRRIDALEQRLHSMVDKVEGKLQRALQPLQVNTLSAGTETPAQQGQGQRLEKQPAIAGGTHGVLGSTSQALGVPAAHSARDGTSDSGGDHWVSPQSAGLSVLELQRMLIQLNHMESKENEVRRKWFHDASGPRPRGPIAQPLVVRDGQVSTLDNKAGPSSSSSPRPVGQSHLRHRLPLRSSTSCLPAHSGDALANAASDKRPAATSAPRGRPSGWSVVATADSASIEAHIGTAPEQAAQARDPISEATLESVLRGRRRFLRAQKLADGDLMVAAEPNINPMQIMEDVADALLDEVLYEQAQELLGLCDSVGETLYKQELALDEADE